MFDERNFAGRFEALELLELVSLDGPAVEAMSLIAALEDVDARLFARLRMELAAGRHRGKAFWDLLAEFCGGEGDNGWIDGWWRANDEQGYDTLDAFTIRLCSFLPMPVPTRMLEAEMVDYHKTPARVVLEIARRVTAEDVFVDLGAGLGQVVLLVHLLTGARVRGLEIEPAFCGYARECAAALGLAGGLGLAAVAFVEGDARFANYAEGTVFFMYTPFRGALLETVFGLLRQEALSRSFMLVTFGPCTEHAARQDWLRMDGPPPDGADGLCFFRAG